MTGNWTTSNLHAGTFTAACGVFIYRGDLLEGLRGDALVCEPTGSLVHRDRLRSTGSACIATRVEEGAEFLASSDEWFRPVNMTCGPEGALYIAALHRAVIEHPQWMPPEEKSRPDLLHGRGLGRIFRVVPEGGGPRKPSASLSRARPESLVAALSHRSAFHRETAQRLLVEEQVVSAVPALLRLAGAGPAAARFQSLWTLSGLGRLEGGTIAAALRDPDPLVRGAALRLAEPLLSREAALRAAVAALAGDPDRGVRFQAALSLGDLAPAEAFTPLLGIAAREAHDRWFRSALISSSSADPAGFLSLLLRKVEAAVPAAVGGEVGPEGRLELLRGVALLAAARKEALELARLLTEIVELPAPAALDEGGSGAGSGPGIRADVRLACAAGLARGLRQRGETLPGVLRRGEGEVIASARRALERLFREAEIVAGAAGEGPAAPGPRGRLDAIEVLSAAPHGGAMLVLGRLLDGDPLPEVRRAAARALGARGSDEAADRLIESLRTQTPAVRREAVEGLLRHPAGPARLLRRIEEGELGSSEMEPAQRERLLRHPDPGIRARAEKALIPLGAGERSRTIESYRLSLALPADGDRGRRAFERACATCHRVAGVGTDVGPDISDTRERTAESLLLDILDPNRAIDGAFLSYSITTRDRRVQSGIIASETGSAVTLKRAAGETETVLRQEIESISSSGASLMPEGLERDLTPQDMADLIRFLKTWRRT